jgi:hypothetical protein
MVTSAEACFGVRIRRRSKDEDRKRKDKDKDKDRDRKKEKKDKDKKRRSSKKDRDDDKDDRRSVCVSADVALAILRRCRDGCCCCVLKWQVADSDYVNAQAIVAA